MKRALLFPGQGSQSIGMGRDLAENYREARDVFDEVDDALSAPLSRLMWTGEPADLDLTENAQPALLAVSMAVMRVIEKQLDFAWGIHAHYVAGHSLGEYSALTAAGTFSLPQAARVLRLRGQAMQRATPLGTGAMAIPVGTEIAQVEEIVAAASQARSVVEIANDNAPGQVVISGHAEAIARAIEIAKEKGVRRVLPVKVTAPFHSSLMAPAQKEMEEVLGALTLAPPRVPCIANFSALPVSDPGAIRRLLIQQVTGRVRWRESVLSLAGLGVTSVTEIGAGKTLTGQAKRTDPNLQLSNIETPGDVEAFQKLILPVFAG